MGGAGFSDDEPGIGIVADETFRLFDIFTRHEVYKFDDLIVVEISINTDNPDITTPLFR